MEYKEVFESWAQGKIESKRAIGLLQNECLEYLSKMADLNDMANGKLTAQQRFNRMLNPSTFDNELLYKSENLRRSTVIITEYIKKIERIEEEEKRNNQKNDNHIVSPEAANPPEKPAYPADSGDQGQNDDKTAKAKNHYLMQRLKLESPITYKAMCKALEDEFVTFDQGQFDFHCDKGCVGLFFKEGGFTEYKTLKEYILIKMEPPAETTLENCTKNTPPKSWKIIKEKYFDTPTK